jgi:hypothetical protein
VIARGARVGFVEHPLDDEDAGQREVPGEVADAELREDAGLVQRCRARGGE